MIGRELHCCVEFLQDLLKLHRLFKNGCIEIGFHYDGGMPYKYKREVLMALFSFFILLVSMILIDGLWFALMLKSFYIPKIGHLLSDSIAITPGIIFYILYGIGLNIFVVLPSLRNNTDYLGVLLLGLLFGMVTYGTYDLTNQATLKNWPWLVTLVDIAWGSCLAGAISLISTFLTRYFGIK